MEKMPYQTSLDATPDLADLMAALPATQDDVTSSDWRERLPVLSGRRVTLRELQFSDAPSLCTLLTTEEVTRFISPPPTTVEGFERFIAWTHRQRALGQYVCFAVVPTGGTPAVGLFQVRQLEPGFKTAEWGFAIGSPYWGSGLYSEGANLLVSFVFDAIGVHRLEARAATINGRGNGALAKVGAVFEGVLRRSFLRDGHYLDQNLWSIIDEEWRESKAVRTQRTH
jgi:RimJ/RimL family protein N-acetyltransferase